jgi:hypothetical protein
VYEEDNWRRVPEGYRRLDGATVRTEGGLVTGWDMYADLSGEEIKMIERRAARDWEIEQNGERSPYEE